MNGQMPEVDLEALKKALPPRLYGVALKCLVVRKSGARLRASRPETSVELGVAAYAWRMAAFSVSPRSRHHCMPACATFYLDASWGTPEYERLRDMGDRIEQALVFAIPVAQWHGVRRWGQAYGLVGTPRYDEDGAVIYR